MVILLASSEITLKAHPGLGALGYNDVKAYLERGALGWP